MLSLLSVGGAGQAPESAYVLLLPLLMRKKGTPETRSLHGEEWGAQRSTAQHMFGKAWRTWLRQRRQVHSGNASRRNPAVQVQRKHCGRCRGSLRLGHRVILLHLPQQLPIHLITPAACDNRPQRGEQRGLVQGSAVGSRVRSRLAAAAV